MYTRRLEQRQRQEATLHPEPLALPGASKGTTAASLSGTSCQGGAATSCWTPRNCGAQGVGSPSHQGTACARVQCAGATAGRGCNQGTACARTSLRTLLTRACNQGTACAVERSWTGYRTPWILEVQVSRRSTLHELQRGRLPILQAGCEGRKRAAKQQADLKGGFPKCLT